MIKASETVGKVLKKGDIVIYESTVYPGATEEECVPVLEKVSGLTFNQDFYCGYSPERINPGDKEHTVTKIKKVFKSLDPDVQEAVKFLINEIQVKREIKKLEKFITLFTILHINTEISIHSTELIKTYAKSHSLDIPDSLIAATALEKALTLFTYNTKDFKYISHIKLL